MPKGIPRDKSIQHKIIYRYKIARGHLDKVIKMVEGGEYCIDIIHQSLAVQAALRQVDNVVLKNHLETCVSDAIKKGHTEEVVDEIMKVMEKK
jgi:DNA-binding FrmR family transcriptional regulator